MNRTTFEAFILAFAVSISVSGTSIAQNVQRDTSTAMHEALHAAPSLEPPADTTAFMQVTVEDRLKAKVDSLRSVLEESSPSRRRRSSSRTLAAADSLRLHYNFQAASDLLKRAVTDADSTLKDRMEESLRLSMNGLNMTSYCNSPVVVAKKKFPLKDFFLMYPMADRSWRPSPNPLDAHPDSISQAVYVPENSGTVYFSAKDSNGIRNVYLTRESDGEWSFPQLTNESITSPSDEIYPMTSQDGKTLYFASKGLYGMGGYDLYSSRWNNDTHGWGAPVNMGFPYSSPYDDFLFMNTDDGKHSVFASNRECSPDSVYIYVLEYDAMPPRRSVSEAGELYELSLLNPSNGGKRGGMQEEMNNQAEGPDVSSYLSKMENVRVMRDSIYSFNKELDEMRERLAEATAYEQSGHIAAILAKEQVLSRMQDSLNLAIKTLQNIELDFLASGVLLDIAQTQEEKDSEPAFIFERHYYGDSLDMSIEAPAPERDFAFEILPSGRFHGSNVLPDGIIFQIEMATSPGKFSEKDLNGLSPVFEKMSTSLVYTYSVGIFHSYQSALSCLNAVRAAGFKDARITAYSDGEKVSVEYARSKNAE